MATNTRTEDEMYMGQCIKLAQKGAGFVAPNPMVGCIIVHDGKVIGEGYHQKYGEAHAEVNAINAVQNHEQLKTSTLYVSLEPCSHYGKTPPCSDLIVQKQIPRVVIGIKDPFSKVAGNGIKRLKNAGIKVVVGVMEDECKKLNKRFFTFHQKKRPYIILKWAQTLDGFIDVERGSENYGQPTWITNQTARVHVHKTRAEEAAILVGTNTAIKDNPSLTVRDWQGNNPLRLVFDRQLKLPPYLNIFNEDAETVVFNSLQGGQKGHVCFVKLDNEKDTVPQVLAYLHQREALSLIVEGGAQTIQHFVKLNLWDEAHVYEGPVKFHKGVTAPKLQGVLVGKMAFDESSLSIIKNPGAI